MPGYTPVPSSLITAETLRAIRHFMDNGSSVTATQSETTNPPVYGQPFTEPDVTRDAAQAAARAWAESMKALKEYELLKKGHRPQKTRFKNESSFRAAVLKALGKRAFMAQAIESTTAAGIPDVYTVGVVNGESKSCWAELKVVKRGQVAKVTALQWKWLTDHAKASGNSYLIVNDHSHGGIWVLKVTCQTLPNLRDMKYIRSSSYQLKKSYNPLDDLVNAL